MKKFVPREKLGRKARKQLDSEQRTTWVFSPVTKKVEIKKLYNRKKKSHDRYDDYGMGFSVVVLLRYRKMKGTWSNMYFETNLDSGKDMMSFFIRSTLLSKTITPISVL